MSQSVTASTAASGAPIDTAAATVVATDAPIATQVEIASPQSTAATSQPSPALPVEPPADILTNGAAASGFVAAAVELESGATRWVVRQSDTLAGVGLPDLVDGERVMLPSGACGGNVIASVDARTGDAIWRSSTDVAITDMGFRGPGEQIEIVAGIAVLSASIGDRPMLIGIDPATGVQKWIASVGQVAAEVLHRWLSSSAGIRRCTCVDRA